MNELQSESIKNIAAALAKAQGEMGKAVKDGTNPHFRSKFASLDAVIDASREALTSNGIAVVQNGIMSATSAPLLVCTLLHTSGEWIRGFYPLTPAKQNDPQALGSAMTYMRRYSLSSMVGISQSDDDGEAASAPAKPRDAKASPTTPTPKQEQAANTIRAEPFTPQRAIAMKGKLRELGYDDKHIYSLATTHVGRDITDLVQLSYEEALEVFEYAQKGGRNVGKAA